uniref:RCC1-like domain-containing protein n=1 Tax=Sedimentibacter sp. B4 TaxID=304766 RepID=UPI001E41FEF3
VRRGLVAEPSGTSPTDVYGGAATSATHSIGSGTPSDYGLTFTAVAVGATHACGVANGTVYCWGRHQGRPGPG